MDLITKYYVTCPRCHWKSESFPCPSGIWGPLEVWVEDLKDHVDTEHKLYSWYITTFHKILKSKIDCEYDQQ